jgi:hypothetical protein
MADSHPVMVAQLLAVGGLEKQPLIASSTVVEF